MDAEETTPETALSTRPDYMMKNREILLCGGYRSNVSS